MPGFCRAQVAPPLVVCSKVELNPPPTQPLFSSANDTWSSWPLTVEVCAAQVCPPSVLFAILPPVPTIQPVVAFTKKTSSKMLLIWGLTELQVAPASVVRLAPPLPTITAVWLSMTSTPCTGEVPRLGNCRSQWRPPSVEWKTEPKSPTTQPLSGSANSTSYISPPSPTLET